MSELIHPGSTAEEVATGIVRRLQNAGHAALFAGGSVRDALRGFPPKDFDIVTSAKPATVQQLFAKTIPVGVQFGVVRVVESGFEFEVATFRGDGEYRDGRRPESVVFADAREDALRRDFTVNGMFYDPILHETVDYVGGREDLARRVLRAIGNPEDRFGEDRLRLMRTVRFAAALEFAIEAQTWAAVCRHAKAVRVVSPERIREELMKMLGDSNRGRAFDLLDASGLLEVILPEVTALKGCEQPPQFHPEGDVFVHTRKMIELLAPDAPALLVMTVLLHDIGKPPTQTFDVVDQRIRFNGHDQVGAEMAESVMQRLRFSGEQTQLVVEAVRGHMVFKDVREMRPAKLRRLLARPYFPLELELHRVDCGASHGDLGNLAFLKAKQEEFAAESLIPPPLVNGNDLIELGLRPGPRFKVLLDELQTAQLEGQITSRAEALQHLRNLAESDLAEKSSPG